VVLYSIFKYKRLEISECNIYLPCTSFMNTDIKMQQCYATESRLITCREELCGV
jgi:hypothetical protein